MSVFQDLISKMREAEDRVGDPVFTNLMIMYERKIAGMEFDDNQLEKAEDFIE